MLHVKFNRVSRFCTRIFLLFLLATTVWQTIVFVLPRSQADSGTTIAIDPVESIADPGNSFSVNITIAGVGVDVVTDVYSYQVKLGFDKNVLAPVYKTALAMEGPYLKTYAEDNLFQAPIPTVKFDNPNYVYFADSLFGASTPGCYYESGVLFTVEFQVKAAGVSTLDVFGSIIVSYDGAGTQTNHYPPADFTESEGNFHTNYPVAAFSFSPNTYGRPIVGENVTFDGSDSFAQGSATLVSYVWNFSDGTPLGSGMIVKHVYSNPSTLSKPYNATLTVTDNNGLSTMTYRKNLNEQLSVKRHDIAIVNITKVTTGDILVHQDVVFNVTVVNNGTHGDTFNVTSYCNERPFNTTKFPTGAIDLAPGKNATITVILKTFINQTTVVPSEKGTGSGWTVDSYNASVSDDVYSYSSTDQATQDFSTYKGFDGTGWERVSKVEVGLEVKTDSGGDDMLSVQVFAGLGWTEEHFLTVNSTTDTLVWIDVTGDLTWLPTLLQQNRAVVKVKYIQVGPVATPIYIDWIPLRITPSNPIDLPPGSYDLWARTLLVDPITLAFRAGEEANITNDIFVGEPVTLTVKPIHDVAVDGITVSPKNVAFGGRSSIEVKVKNWGNLAEVIDISVYVNSTSVGNRTDVDILAGATKTFTFNWFNARNDTVEGIYNVTAQVAWIVNSTGFPLEGNLTNNVKTEMVLMRLLPVASFNFSPATPDIGEAVSFDASKSYAPGVPGGSIQNYSWDFGDGSTGTGVTVSHVFTSPGSRGVKLTVRDDQNLNSTLTKSVLVPKLVSNITLSSSSLVVPLSLNTTLTGGILPVRANATVAIYFKPVADANWNSLYNATTNAQGAYSFVWVPDELGLFTLRVQWSGDDNTLGATSSSLNVTVTLQDTSILSVIPLRYLVIVGDSLPIDVTVANNGTATESVSLSAYYNNTLLETKVLSSFAAGTSQRVRFTLETLNLTEGVYFIKAVSTALPGETSIQDNSRTVAVFVQQEQEAPPPEEGTSIIFMYATIGLAVALVAVVVFFFFKMRKS
jgi:hypothetical protein